MKTIYLGFDSLNSRIFNRLGEIGLVSIDNHLNIHGKSGLSSNPQWVNWAGYYFENSKINLSDKGIEILKNNSDIDYDFISVLKQNNVL